MECGPTTHRCLRGESQKTNAREGRSCTTSFLSIDPKCLRCLLCSGIGSVDIDKQQCGAIVSSVLWDKDLWNPDSTESHLGHDPSLLSPFPGFLCVGHRTAGLSLGRHTSAQRFFVT